MIGLCQNCFESGIEVTVVSSEVLCQACARRRPIAIASKALIEEIK